MHKPRILIVDDEQGLIRLLKIVLENTGRYSVHQENDATKAVDAARLFKPELILLDYVMPKMDGITLAQELRADPQFRHTPVVFLTATVVENESGSSEIAGFPALSKPIALNRLMAVIDSNLAAPLKIQVAEKPTSLLSSMARRLRGVKGIDGTS